MHVEERDSLILDLIGKTGFVSFKNLEASISASPATLRRDLDRLESKGVIQRVRGGARLVADEAGERTDVQSLAGIPFHENIDRNRKQKEAIEEWRNALRMSPNNRRIQGRLAESLHLGNFNAFDSHDEWLFLSLHPAALMDTSYGDALLAAGQQDWDRAADLLTDVLPGLPRVGGSAAQREIVEETLLFCLVSAGRAEQALALLDGRLDRRTSPLDRRRRDGLATATVPA